MTATSALPLAAFAQPISFKVRAKFGTSFSNHNMTVPQMLMFKLSNEIELETDLTFARQWAGGPGETPPPPRAPSRIC